MKKQNLDLIIFMKKQKAILILLLIKNQESLYDFPINIITMHRKFQSKFNTRTKKENLKCFNSVNVINKKNEKI